MSTSTPYFAQVANSWDEIRAGFFTEAMRDAAIALVDLPAGASVADVGTGTGFVLTGLLGKAARLVGYDESAEMLEVARRNFTGRPEVRFEQAEGQNLPAAPASFDAVFANMYLHHTPDPAAAIREMARILKPGGTLVITDLDAHDQAWMQDTMADRWLGFDRAVVREWYQEAGLTHIEIADAAGTCDSSNAAGDAVSLSIFVATGRK